MAPNPMAPYPMAPNPMVPNPSFQGSWALGGDMVQSPVYLEPPHLLEGFPNGPMTGGYKEGEENMMAPSLDMRFFPLDSVEFENGMNAGGIGSLNTNSNIGMETAENPSPLHQVAHLCKSDLDDCSAGKCEENAESSDENNEVDTSSVNPSGSTEVETTAASASSSGEETTSGEKKSSGEETSSDEVTSSS
ncbi:hypothetical protein HHI36_022134 [Cryptolaemus montrouzieri]|uniref:Uncharacterized protein n=1 Tax=Cryptolaemus montrouzieri TaxID=559131 RepID=A0ABD2MZ56_9CUCU